MRMLPAALIAAALSASPAHAEVLAGQDAAAQRQRLIEQKLRLVESLVNAPAAQRGAEGRPADAATLASAAKAQLEQARAALAANRLDEAAAVLDGALRSASQASARIAGQGGSLTASAQQASFRSLNEQVATYRAAIDDLARQGGEGKAVSARLADLHAEATRMADAGRLGDANRRLGEAYKFAIESLSRLRAGQTVTLSLKFDTPADEYAYERKRFHSSEILVAMMLDEGRADGERRNGVDGSLREGRQLKDLAATQADGGDYRTAVATMERAAGHLNRALQLMGVPVF